MGGWGEEDRKRESPGTIRNEFEDGQHHGVMHLVKQHAVFLAKAFSFNCEIMPESKRKDKESRLWRGRRHGIEKAQSEATGFLHA